MIAKRHTLTFVFLLALSLLVLMTSLASAQPQVEEIDKLTEDTWQSAISSARFKALFIHNTTESKSVTAPLSTPFE